MVPTSTRRHPLAAMMSGIRKLPPISTSSPRETDTELRRRVSYDLVRIIWVAAVVIGVGLGLGFLVK